MVVLSFSASELCLCILLLYRDNYPLEIVIIGGKETTTLGLTSQNGSSNK